MKNLGEWLASVWYPLLLWSSAFIAVAFLLWFQLDKLVPGISTAEQMYLEASGSFTTILRNPLFLPHKLLTEIFSNINLAPPSRIASTIFAFMIAGSFYYVLRSWYTRRVALLGSVLFITSAWFLHLARFGAENIMYSLLIVPIAAGMWLQKEKNNLAIAINALLVIILLYIPGFIWITAPLLLWQSRRILRFLKRQNPIIVLIIGFSGLALLTPLIFAMAKNTSLAMAYIGFPEVFPSLSEFAKNAVNIPRQLFIFSDKNPEIWLGRLPLISWFGSVMFVIGTYAYYFKLKLDRTWYMTYVFVVGTILVALNGPVEINILLPFVYIIIAGGIALMLQQWFTVFPRNPLAGTLGPTLMTVVILLTAFYNINHYFIAWPNSPDTKSVYGKDVPENQDGSGAILLQ